MIYLYIVQAIIYKMLFKYEMIKPIINGIKTETRRAWNRCMVKEHGIYKAKTNYSKDSIFAWIKIMYIRREKLGDIDEDGVRKEGYRSIIEFMNEWSKIYGSWDPDLPVYVIGFRVVKVI